jgi:hypothetical protein
MILPKDIQEIFFETLYGDKTVLEFEQWLYANKQLEHILSADDYLDLIAYGYKGNRAAQGLYPLLEKQINRSEYKMWTLARKRLSFVQGMPATPIETPFDEQLERIKDKLTRARHADAKCREFGSETHEYLINIPATEEELSAFENRYTIQLPLCYRSFLLKVGNGGIGLGESGAGPYFGIYPLGYGLNDLVRTNGEKYLKNDCTLDPDMTAEQWEALREFTRNRANISQEAYESKKGRLFGGILPLGSQGCTYIHGIVLNGAHKGHIVNLDFGCILPPIFAPHTNFLHWYEEWLDEVISGKQRRDSMFGY